MIEQPEVPEGGVCRVVGTHRGRAVRDEAIHAEAEITFNIKNMTIGVTWGCNVSNQSETH